MPSDALPWSVQPELAKQAQLIERLARAVMASVDWRWLEVGCSLAAGRGDALSDVDAAVGYAEGVSPDGVEIAGSQLVEAGGSIVDCLAHMMPGRPSDTTRFAVEYGNDVQLDLVVMPAERRVGLPTGSVAVVDKDGRLSKSWRPPVADPPTPAEAREWVMFAWWAISDAAKYLHRGALYEAVDRIAEARQLALRLFAVGRRIPYPSFGLVSLLDFPPYELPESLAQTYGVPDSRAAVQSSAEATASILARAATEAGVTLGAELQTRWADVAWSRLSAERSNRGKHSR